jgi:hypothetical protein
MKLTKEDLQNVLPHLENAKAAIARMVIELNIRDGAKDKEWSSGEQRKAYIDYSFEQYTKHTEMFAEALVSVIDILQIDIMIKDSIFDNN